MENCILSELSKIVKGGFLNLIGSVGAKILLLFFTIFVAKVLGPGDIGLYSLGIVICELLVLLSNLGLPTGATRFVAIYNVRNDLQRMKGVVLIATIATLMMSLAASGALFFSADFIAVSILHKPALGEVLRWLSFSIPFECVMRVFTASTLGLKLVQHTAYIEHIAWGGLRFVFVILFLAGFNMGLKGVNLAYVASSVITAGLACYYANKKIPLFNRQITPIFEVKELFTFSFPILFSTLIYDLLIREDIMMLGYFSNAIEVGIYSVVTKFLNSADIIFYTFKPIFNPIIVELHEKKEYDKLSNLVKLVTRWDITLSYPIFLSLLLFPKFFLKIFGRGFIQGAACFSILVIVHILKSIPCYQKSIITMSGRSHTSLLIDFISLISNFIFNYLLIPPYGTVGAALATLISIILTIVINILIVYYIFKIHPLSKSLWRPLIAGGIPFLVLSTLTISKLLIINNITTIFIIILFLISYLFIISIFGFNDEELYIKGKIIWYLRSLI